MNRIDEGGVAVAECHPLHLLAREFHSSSPGDGLKVDETASVLVTPTADVVAFEEARRTLSAWLFAKRLKQYRRMKQLEGGEGWREMPAVAREFHSSSPGDGLKVDETASADVVAFQGDAGPEVAFVERATSDVGDTEASDEAPVC